MFLRLTGASVRAVLVAISIMLPAFLLSDITATSIEFTRIIATIAAVIVMYEYGFSTASIIEFRFAAPYNRVRFIIFSCLVLVSCHIVSGAVDGNPVNGYLNTIGDSAFPIINFVYSPMNIVAETLSAGDPVLADAIAHAIAVNAFLSLSCVFAFYLAIYTNLWRFGDANFNLWLNMPTYKSYGTKSLQRRLRNSAYSSFLIAVLIPLFGPVLANTAIESFTLNGKPSMILIVWVLTFWTYFPVAFLMRAIAIYKVGTPEKVEKPKVSGNIWNRV